MTARAAILDEARRIVTQDRNRTYGPPEDAFAALALMERALVMARGAREPDALDACANLIALKLLRAVANPAHLDSFVDGAGYFACAGEIAGRLHGADAAPADDPRMEAWWREVEMACSLSPQDIAEGDWTAEGLAMAEMLQTRIRDRRKASS